VVKVSLGSVVNRLKKAKTINKDVSTETQKSPATKAVKVASIVDGPRSFKMYQAGEYEYAGFHSTYELIGFVDTVFEEEELALVKTQVLKPLKQGMRPWKWRFGGFINPFEIDGFIEVELRGAKIHDIMKRAANNTAVNKPPQLVKKGAKNGKS